MEYKSPEDCEKALELDGKQMPYSMKDGLVVQLARSDPYSARRGDRGRDYGRGGYGRGYGRGGYGARTGGGYGARGGYGGYGGPYPPPPRSRGGYGYPSYGYERGGYGGYGGAYGARGGRDGGYGGYGARDYGYGRDAYGYRGYDDYRGPDEPAYDPRERDRYHNGERRREGGDYSYERAAGDDGARDEREARSDRETRDDRDGREARDRDGDYPRGRYSRSASPKRERSRSRSPSR